MGVGEGVDDRRKARRDGLDKGRSAALYRVKTSGKIVPHPDQIILVPPVVKEDRLQSQLEAVCDEREVGQAHVVGDLGRQHTARGLGIAARKNQVPIGARVVLR
ncbi:hypothetical protein Sbs19_39070 [Sphingobium sp. BS19]|nr:hypothetical protein Sbs19_39070 [Sphingobium sp. BS19]